MCKDCSQVGEGWNVTLSGSDVVPAGRDLSHNKLTALPESFGNLLVGGLL